MKEHERKPILVAGIGNPDCGDDAAGLVVARALKRSMAAEFDVKELRGEPMELMAAMKGREEAILVDAIAPFSGAGTLHMIDASRSPLPVELFGHVSTHSFGLVESIELARVLGDLPPRILVVGIEGANFEPSSPLSPAVKKATRKAVDWIVKRSGRDSLAGMT